MKLSKWFKLDDIKSLRISILIFTFFLGLAIEKVYSIRSPWFNIATSGVSIIRQPKHCDALKGLVNRQKRICRKFITLMPAVRVGAEVAIDECQFQFKNRRWNCSQVSLSTVFGKVLTLGTRETAFVYSIASAGVAWAVTKACSTGQMIKCGCDRSITGKSVDDKGRFEWAGCSENVAYGVAFSQKFVDARERLRKNPIDRVLMNLHNNMAGRHAVENSIRTTCKCHGVSGSCEMRTCWKQLSDFRHIGDVIMNKFNEATMVEKVSTQRKKYSLEPIKRNKRHSDADLVYLKASPDYCEPDSKSGSLGTKHRLCSKKPNGLEGSGCDLMCCGRGYMTQEKQVIERCHCKFYWCCKVKCKQCLRQVQETRCL